jgi:hypothetical protein
MQSKLSIKAERSSTNGSIARHGVCVIFTSFQGHLETTDLDQFAPNPPKPASDLRSARFALQPCTNSGHPPVDAPHSTENTRVKNANFSLTIKIESVKP